MIESANSSILHRKVQNEDEEVELGNLRRQLDRGDSFSGNITFSPRLPLLKHYLPSNEEREEAEKCCKEIDNIRCVIPREKFSCSSD